MGFLGLIILIAIFRAIFGGHGHHHHFGGEFFGGGHCHRQGPQSFHHHHMGGPHDGFHGGPGGF